jgi:hypothetical protein
MANRVAAYKQQRYLGALESWWQEYVERHGIVFTTPEGMFDSYTDYQLTHSRYWAVVSYDDFQKLAYKQGIRRLGTGQMSDFVRSHEWRPSDERVMRLAALELA